MKKTTAKIVTISDIVQWYSKGEIELSPKYQRNTVWNDTAKSYLMDTIIRGLPIPPIFLRQKVDINTKTTSREIIDGQQRIRSIIEYVVKENIVIKKNHNKEFGGKRFDELEDEVKEAILEYEILAEVVTENDDGVIYDMFARLNSNNIVLNDQEIRNSKYWGDFKVLVYRLSSKYRDFFLSTRILSDRDCSRMKDSELINSMLILLTEGIVKETPKSVEGIYKKFDKDFIESEACEEKIEVIMRVIQDVFNYLSGNYGCFDNKNYFFTLYAVLVHQLYGIINVDTRECVRKEIFSNTNIFNNQNALFGAITQFIVDYNEATSNTTNGVIDAKYQPFIKNHKVRTTGKEERKQRIYFLNNEIAK